MAEKNILIVAGEVSSDLHSANLIKELKKLDPEIKFFGLGGKFMLQEKVELLYNLTELATVGFWDVIKNFKKFKNIYKKTLSYIEKKSPKLAILVDYPGFNLKLAQELKKRKIPVIYYISPQVWAWGKSRIKKIKNTVDLMLVLFKFEEEFYKKYNLNAIFVGHPLLDIVKPSLGRDSFLKRFSLCPTKYTISLLAGSRLNEIKMHLPIMLKISNLIYEELKDVKFLILKPSTLNEELYRYYLQSYKLPVYIISDATYDGLSLSDFALVCAGTATLETALLSIPMVIIYKLSLINWLILRPLVKVPYIGMVNIIAKRKIVPEFIQYQIKPKSITKYIIETITDEKKIKGIKESLSEIKSYLGSPQASLRAARVIYNFLEGKKL
jgi:lipid-A-disaccharide synthase